MNDNKKHPVKKDMRRLISVSASLIVALVGVMFFSPLSYQFYDEGFSRGSSWEMDIDALVNANQEEQALNLVDSLIDVKDKALPRIAYFDRFLPEDEQYNIANARADLYELQWKRIMILKEIDDNEALLVALKQYSKVMGYNQDKAESMFKNLKNN